MTMRALRFEDGDLALVRRPLPTPVPGEALVRVRMAGICATDLEIVRGYMGFVGTLGHEFVGEISACEDPARVGQRVTGEINAVCGRCTQCMAGRARHCDARSVLGILSRDGCFADYLTLPLPNLHPVPEGLSDEAACFAEPTAAAFEVVEQGLLEAGASVAVIGDGRLGLLIAMVLSGAGGRVTLVGRHGRKRAIAEAAGIATAAPGELPARAWDVVVEATGAAAGMEAAMGLVRPQGTIVLKSTYADRLSLNAAPLVIDEIRLVGSRCGPFEPALAALAAGQVDPTPLVDAVLPLEDGVDAMARAGTRGVLKVLLDMRGSWAG